MKIRGIAAFEAASLLKAESVFCCTWTGADVLLDVLREEAERVFFLEEPVFELLEEVPERDLDVFAIISRCSLSP